MGLPAGFKIPGIYTSFDRNTDPGGIAPNNRALLWGIVPPGAPVARNVPFLTTGARQVDTYCFAYSQAARNYRAGKSNLPAGVGAEIYLLPVDEPASGTKAIHPIQFMALPTFDDTKGWILGTNPRALADTQCEIDFGGQSATFLISFNTLFADIPALAVAALLKVVDLVVVPADAGAGLLTITDRLKGEQGNDLPTRVTFSNPAAGVAASPGTVTFANTAGGAGGAILHVDDFDSEAAIGNTDVPATSAVKLRNQINADSGPLSAATADPATAVVTLFFRDDQYSHRISTSVSGIAPQTLTPAVGTAGSGVPDIVAALTKLTGDSQAYKVWAFPGTDIDSWSKIATHVIAQDATPVEKGQTVHGCITGAIPDFSVALSNATTPKLFTSELFAIHYQAGAVVRGGELAARAACMVAAEEFQGRNFNGRRLVGTASMPLGVPHRNRRPTLDTLNTLITTFCFSPIVVDSGGYNAVLRSTTTFLSAGPIQDKLTKWSGALIPIYFRASLRVRLSARFKEKNLKQYSEPQTNNSVGLKGVKAEVYSLVREWDAQDLYDGAEGVKDAIKAGVKVSPTRVNVEMPFRNVGDLDQVDIDAYQA